MIYIKDESDQWQHDEHWSAWDPRNPSIRGYGSTIGTALNEMLDGLSNEKARALLTSGIEFIED